MLQCFHPVIILNKVRSNYCHRHPLTVAVIAAAAVIRGTMLDPVWKCHGPCHSRAPLQGSSDSKLCHKLSTGNATAMAMVVFEENHPAPSRAACLRCAQLLPSQSSTPWKNLPGSARGTREGRRGRRAARESVRDMWRPGPLSQA